MARYSILSTDSAPVPAHYMGHSCTVCKEPFKKGEQVQDLYVYKLGQLDWIEEQHDTCPNGTEKNVWQSGTVLRKSEQVITLQDYRKAKKLTKRAGNSWS
jgi:hypothetical protein